MVSNSYPYASAGIRRRGKRSLLAINRRRRLCMLLPSIFTPNSTLPLVDSIAALVYNIWSLLLSKGGHTLGTVSTSSYIIGIFPDSATLYARRRPYHPRSRGYLLVLNLDPLGYAPPVPF